MRGLERRIRKLESVLPPLLTDKESWICGVLWFSVAHYWGIRHQMKNRLPHSAELWDMQTREIENAMEDHRLRDLAERIGIAIGPNQNGPVPLAKDRVDARFDPVARVRDLSNKLYRAEEEVLTRFGIDTASLEYSRADAKRLSETLKRMEAGLPQSYRDQLKMVLRRVDNLAWMRVHSDDVAPYIRCFA